MRVRGLGGRGFLGNHAIFTPQACANRQSVRLYDAFRALYGTDHLVVSVDRLGFMRPTKGLQLPTGGVVDKAEWATLKNWLHWCVPGCVWAVGAALGGLCGPGRPLVPGVQGQRMGG